MNQRREHIRKSSLARRQLRPWSLGFAVRAFALAGAVMACAASAQMRGSTVSASRIEALRSEIEVATDQHAANERLGTLWLRLADGYQDRHAFPEAEEAYGRALSLLRSPATQLGYANSLEGLGSVYSLTGRSAEAVNCLHKAVGIYQVLGDRAHVARLHEGIAIAMVVEHRFSDAEKETSEALRELEAESKPDSSEMGVVLLTRSYARCFQGRCDTALEDARRGLTLTQAIFPANSLEVASAWLALGVDEWKSGSVEEGGRKMREALRIVRSRTDLPPAVLVDIEVGMLGQYDLYLKATHHKPEAKAIENEIAQMESRQPSVCRNCTINATALVGEAPRR